MRNDRYIDKSGGWAIWLLLAVGGGVLSWVIATFGEALATVLVTALVLGIPALVAIGAYRVWRIGR